MDDEKGCCIPIRGHGLSKWREPQFLQPLPLPYAWARLPLLLATAILAEEASCLRFPLLLCDRGYPCRPRRRGRALLGGEEQALALPCVDVRGALPRRRHPALRAALRIGKKFLPDLCTCISRELDDRWRHRYKKMLDKDPMDVDALCGYACYLTTVKSNDEM